MKSTNQLIDEAIKMLQGKKKFPIGSVVAHPDDPVARELIAYEDDEAVAVLEWDGGIKRWPANEIVNPAEVQMVTLRLRYEDILAARKNASQN